MNATDLIKEILDQLVKSREYLRKCDLVLSIYIEAIDMKVLDSLIERADIASLEWNQTKNRKKGCVKEFIQLFIWNHMLFTIKWTYWIVRLKKTQLCLIIGHLILEICACNNLLPTLPMYLSRIQLTMIIFQNFQKYKSSWL